MAWQHLHEGALLNERYRIRRTLGQGGMGTVYLADDLRLRHVVAVKEVGGEQTPEHQAALDRCAQEVGMLVRLHHANLPKVTDAFVEGERFYLVMEYVEGVTLKARLQEAGGGPLDVAQVLAWGLQLADVLDYLHRQTPPVIFRDLKPDNVMVQPDGKVRLIDFGIARRLHNDVGKDTTSLGSVGYAPPEQYGQQTDPGSDIYSFGATLHHLLTGREPQHEPFQFPEAHTLNSAVPRALSALLSECVAIQPADRPASSHDVLLRLRDLRDQFAAGVRAASAANPRGATTSGPFARGRAASSPNTLMQWIQSLGGVLALAVVFVLVLNYIHRSAQPDEARATAEGISSDALRGPTPDATPTARAAPRSPARPDANGAQAGTSRPPGTAFTAPIPGPPAGRDETPTPASQPPPTDQPQTPRVTAVLGGKPTRKNPWPVYVVNVPKPNANPAKESEPAPPKAENKIKPPDETKPPKESLPEDGTGAAASPQPSPPVTPPAPPPVEAPAEGEKPPPKPTPEPTEAATPATALLDLNTATRKQIEALPGIGRTLAERILAYRDANGPFTSVEDLRRVKGIGLGRFEQIKPLVRVGNSKK